MKLDIETETKLKLELKAEIETWGGFASCERLRKVHTRSGPSMINIAKQSLIHANKVAACNLDDLRKVQIPFPFWIKYNELKFLCLPINTLPTFHMAKMILIPQVRMNPGGHSGGI